MNTICLHDVLPSVFVGREQISSEVWHQALVFEKGKSYLIEAASGTGKSSLCSFVYGYRRDYEGSISFDGHSARECSVQDWVNLRKNHISMLFQELRLFAELSASENVLIKNRLTDCKTEEQIKSWFAALGIADKWDVPVAKMSFGQQQRVAFVRALCQPYDFIFLDEPVSHLDRENAEVMKQILQEEVRQNGAGVVVTSIGQHLSLDYDKTIRL